MSDLVERAKRIATTHQCEAEKAWPLFWNDAVSEAKAERFNRVEAIGAKIIEVEIQGRNPKLKKKDRRRLSNELTELVRQLDAIQAEHNA